MGSYILPGGKATPSDRFAELHIAAGRDIVRKLATGMGDQVRAVQIDQAVLADIFFRNIDPDNFPDEHVVASERQDLSRLAFDVDPAHLGYYHIPRMITSVYRPFAISNNPGLAYR